MKVQLKIVTAPFYDVAFYEIDDIESISMTRNCIELLDMYKNKTRFIYKSIVSFKTFKE